MKITKNTAYTVSTQHKINYEKLSDITDTNNFLGGDNLYVIDLKAQTITTGVIENTYKDKFNSVVDKATLDNMIEHPEKLEGLKQLFRPTEPVYLVRKDFLPAFKEFGSYGVSNLLDLSGDDKKEISLYDYISNDILKDYKKEDYQFLQYLKNENHLDIYLDQNGVKHTDPFILNYTSGNLSNGTFELDKFIEHLLPRDDIAFAVSGKRYRDHVLLKGPLTGEEAGVDKIIEDIPHYNADEENNECFTLVYYPKTEDLEKIFNWKQDDPDNNKKGIYNISTFVVKEILGGLQFAKDLPTPTEEDLTPKRKFKR